MPVIDVSVPLVSAMPVYPGDPEVEFTRALTVAADDVAVLALHMGSHSGTHIDAPAHTIENGATVEQLELQSLMGETAVLYCRELKPGQLIAAADLLAELPAVLPERVWIVTGWSAFFGAPEMFQHPAVSLQLARALWERGARVLGVDCLSPDLTESTEFAVHDFWLGGGGILVENLTNLSGLPGRVWSSCLPLNIPGGDGSPVRAVAVVN